MKKISGVAFILFLSVLFPLTAMAEASVSFAQTVKDMGANFCWFCPIFGTLFDAMNDIATTISRDMSQTFLAVMGVALLFSIGFKTAKMLTSLQAVDLMQYLTDMFRHLGRAIIASAFLWASLSIFTYVISPFLTMSLSLSTTILNTADITATITQAAQKAEIDDDLKQKKEGGGTISVYNVCKADDDNAAPLLIAEQQALDNGTAPQKAFAPSVKAALMCLLRTVSASLITGMAIGATIFNFGWIDRVMVVFPNLVAVFVGFLIVLGHLLIFVAVPFKYIDSMIRMAFVCALMPLWIILWVFDATKGYTKKAWEMFLSTCAIFMCMSVVLVLVIKLINAAFPPEVLGETIDYLVNGNILKALEVFQVSLKNLLVTIVMCFTGYKMLGTATTLASSFIGTIPNLGVGDSMAQATLKAGKTAGVWGGAGAMAAGRGAKAGLNAIKPGLGDKAASALTSSTAKRVALGVATFGNSEVALGLMKAGKGAVNAYKNRYANAPSPKMGTKGTDMGVNTSAMGLTGTKTFNTTNNGVTESRTQKSYRDAEGNKLTQTFDKKGNLRGESLTRKDGSTMNKLYDAKGNPTLEIMKNKDGSTVRRHYNQDGSIDTTVKDANKNTISTTKQQTDGKGNIVSETTTDKNGRTTTRFDEKGNVVSETTANKDGRTTTRFDEKGNVVSETTANKDGRTTTRFDENGKVRSEVHRDTNDNVDTKKYNASEQLVSESHRDKDGKGSDSTHRYDADGKYYGTDIKYTDGAERAILRDEKGNITGITQINKDGSAFDTEFKNGQAVK
ncbi:MAG: hypothetical protein IKL32_06985, partial [Alphaproteobacteria bacterium]|nr:hypothetical protein [Alphaproteobacteria bacterium]